MRPDDVRPDDGSNRGPARAGAADVPPTGDPQVDEALGALAGIASAPLHEQVERYATVHRRLQDRLADLDG